jgi:hypothetical protein
VGLDEVGLPPAAQAVLKDLAAQYLAIRALLERPDATLEQLQALLPGE